MKIKFTTVKFTVQFKNTKVSPHLLNIYQKLIFKNIIRFNNYTVCE